MILQQTIQILKEKYAPQINQLTISEVRIGIYLTGVRLSDCSYGVSGTLTGSELQCHPKNRDFGSFTPNQITGLSVLDLLESDKDTGIVNSLRVAILNAISSKLIEQGHYKVLQNTDPIDLIDLQAEKTITVVGAFQSYIRKISKTPCKLYVLEINEQALHEADKKYFVPAQEYSKLLPDSDVVIITGLTLVNNTFENLLSAIKPTAQLIITGPSSSFIPDVLFSQNVDMIGAVRITRPELMMKLVSEGAGGYHLFKYCAEKICIVNEN